MFKESSVDKVLNENVSIRDSLFNSFNKQLPMVLEDSHPLFKHALSIHTDKHSFIPRDNIKIKISGRVFATEQDRANNYDEKCIDCFDHNSMLLRKNLFIRFTATIVNCPKRYYLRWQITNTGKEASADGGKNLRGGFDYSEKSIARTKYERTSYVGTHFVQAFLIDSNTSNCVAKSNILTVNIGGG